VCFFSIPKKVISLWILLRCEDPSWWARCCLMYHRWTLSPSHLSHVAALKKRPSMSVVQRTVELFGSAAPQAPSPEWRSYWRSWPGGGPAQLLPWTCSRGGHAASRSRQSQCPVTCRREYIDATLTRPCLILTRREIWGVEEPVRILLRINRCQTALAWVATTRGSIVFCIYNYLCLTLFSCLRPFRYWVGKLLWTDDTNHIDCI
jgi:hypothetical protein